MNLLGRFLRNERGSTAAEFALVLPVALLVMLGLIDVGRYAWNTNRLEKAAQMGTRFAVATSIVPPGLNSVNYVGLACPGKTVEIGDTVCREGLGTVTCTKPSASVSCTCAQTSLGAASCPALGTVDSTVTGPFAKIAKRIRLIAPQVTDAMITISYGGSGIGYAGDPATTSAGGALSDVSPIVSVSVAGVPMRALTILGLQVRLPRTSQSLTLEDGDGAVAY